MSVHKLYCDFFHRRLKLWKHQINVGNFLFESETFLFSWRRFRKEIKLTAGNKLNKFDSAENENFVSDVAAFKVCLLRLVLVVQINELLLDFNGRNSMKFVYWRFQWKRRIIALQQRYTASKISSIFLRRWFPVKIC